MIRDYPDCPECETDILTDSYRGLEDYVCRGCGSQFDAERVPDRRDTEWVIDR